jgi:hypothetical protein
MSRFSIASREAVGQVLCLPDKEFRYLRTVPTVTTWTEIQAVGTFLADSHGRP